MAQGQLLQRYLWLTDLIYRNAGITRDEINRHWQHSKYNDTKEDEIPERTFHRWREAIRLLFDINIVCNRKGNRTYHIENDDDISSNRIQSWILNCFAVNSIISDAFTLRGRILFETIPSGYQYLTQISEALRYNQTIILNYKSFNMESPLPHTIEPYCLKIYKQRWYVIGRRVEINKIRTFALDRIVSLESTGQHFEYPATFDAEEYFSDSIGIIIDDNLSTEAVMFRVKEGQQNYIRSLPIHDSQQEVEKTADYSIFKLNVRPSYDLIQEFLRYGEDLTVISPEWFRDEFCKIAKEMNDNYNL